jgi:hypothetical protein
MARQQEFDLRTEILKLLMAKVEKDQHPSAAQMDIIEQLISPEELPVYATILLNKLQADTYPSLPMIRRLMSLT